MTPKEWCNNIFGKWITLTKDKNDTILNKQNKNAIFTPSSTMIKILDAHPLWHHRGWRKISSFILFCEIYLWVRVSGLRVCIRNVSKYIGNILILYYYSMLGYSVCEKFIQMWCKQGNVSKCHPGQISKVGEALQYVSKHVDNTLGAILILFTCWTRFYRKLL